MVDLKLSRKSLLGEEERSKPLIFDFLIIFLLTLMVTNIVIQSLWLSPVKVSGDSMNLTLDNGDWLLMSKTKEPERGDVVVFAKNKQVNYIKRIIALEGDTLYANEDGIYLKKKGQSEFVLIDDNHAYYSQDSEYDPTFTYIPLTVVGEGEMYVLGDNRNDSKDSRDKTVGLVKTASILGIVPEWSIEHRGRYSGYLDFIENMSNWLRGIFGN